MAPDSVTPDDVTVVVPTRNEADCIDEVLDRIVGLGLPAVIIADDSDDDTPHRVLSARHERVTLLHRGPAARTGGLGGAVVAAMGQVRTPWMLVVDGDGQHPFERAGDLMASASDVDVVVASRYLHGGGAEGLGAVRRRLSRVGVRLAVSLHRRRLGGLSDPLSGFFLVRMSAVPAGSLHPDGFKILLDMLLASPEPMRVREVPVPLGERIAGSSKASASEGARLLRILIRHRLLHHRASSDRLTNSDPDQYPRRGRD